MPEQLGRVKAFCLSQEEATNGLRRVPMVSHPLDGLYRVQGPLGCPAPLIPELGNFCQEHSVPVSLHLIRTRECLFAFITQTIDSVLPKFYPG